MSDKVAKQLASDKTAFQRARHGSRQEWANANDSSDDSGDPFCSPNTIRRIKEENKEKALTIIGLRLEDAQNIYSEDGVREVISDGITVKQLEEDLNGSRANVETFGGEIVRIVYWG